MNSSGIASLSDNVNAQAPQDIQAVQTVYNTVISNVNIYVNKKASAAANDSPKPPAPVVFPDTTTPKAAINASPPTLTVIFPTAIPPTSVPPTAIPPTEIPPTPIPPTPIPQPTSTSAPSASVVLLSAEYLGTGESCSALIHFQVSGAPATGSFHVWNAFYGPEGDVYPQMTLPEGTNGFEAGLGGHGDPAYYRHRVWFTYNGTSSNVLSDLVCPGLTPSP